MQNIPIQPRPALARLRAAMARTVARALGLDRMAALILSRLQAALDQFETMFEAWRAGTLPPLPPAPPPSQRPEAPADHARTPPAAPLFRWPDLRPAALGEAVLEWLFPLPAPVPVPRLRPSQAPRTGRAAAPSGPAASSSPGAACPTATDSPRAPAALRPLGRTARARPASHVPPPVLPRSPHAASRAAITRSTRPPPPARLQKPRRAVAQPLVHFITIS
jgi:hypothetical protein